MTEENLAALILQLGPWPEKTDYLPRWRWLTAAGVQVDPREDNFYRHPLFAPRAAYWQDLFFWAALEELEQAEVYAYLRRTNND